MLSYPLSQFHFLFQEDRLPTQTSCGPFSKSKHFSPVDLTDAGMVVNEVDKAPFIEAVQPVYEEYRGQFGEIIDKIQAAAKE